MWSGANVTVRTDGATLTNPMTTNSMTNNLHTLEAEPPLVGRLKGGWKDDDTTTVHITSSLQPPKRHNKGTTGHSAQRQVDAVEDN